MIDKQKVVNNFKKANFMPMVDELSDSDLDDIKFESKYDVFNNLPQSILGFMFKFKVYLLFLPVAYLALVFAGTALLHLSFIGKGSFVIGPIFIIVAVINLIADVKTSVPSIRSKNFRHVNSGSIFWKANSLNKGERKRFDAMNTIYFLTGHNFTVDIRNLLGFPNDGVQIGDVHYVDDSKETGQKANAANHVLPYSRLDIKSGLPEMQVWRKSVALLKFIAGENKPLPGLVNSDVSVYAGNNEVSVNLQNLFRTSNFGDVFSDLFDEHPTLLGVQVRENVVILEWLGGIKSDFSSPDAIDKDVILQYEERFYTTLDVLDAIQSVN